MNTAASAGPTSSVGQRPASSMPKASHIAAITAGNALECYDFLIYSTFAVFIAKAYFPIHGPVVSLLLSLGTFGIGFVTRPIGGVVLGRLGDRMGRKPAMLISFGLMAVGLLGVAATPTYAQIGIAAPALVVVARLIQGFALGGEIGPSTAYLVEAAPAERRGLVGAMQNASQSAAGLVAAAGALALSAALAPHALATWGWRIAFLAGLTIVPFGLIIRNALPETAPHATTTLPADAVGLAGRFPFALVAISTTLLASGTINTYVGAYMTTYAIDTLRLPASIAFGMSVCTGACGVIFVPIGGALSDRFGRRVVMLAATAVLALAILPAYSLMLSRPSPFVLYAAVALVGVPAALAAAPVLVAITESFSPRLRSFAVGTIYAVAIAIFGGTTQVAVAALTHATHQPLAPAWYRLAATVLGLAAMLLLPETAPVRTAAREDLAGPAVVSN